MCFLSFSATMALPKYKVRPPYSCNFPRIVDVCWELTCSVHLPDCLSRFSCTFIWRPTCDLRRFGNWPNKRSWTWVTRASKNLPERSNRNLPRPYIITSKNFPTCSGQSCRFSNINVFLGKHMCKSARVHTLSIYVTLESVKSSTNSQI